MKKFVSFIAVLVIIALISPNMIIYAASNNSNTYANTYEPVSNQETGMCIIIRDANGTIVETHEIDRTLYVNGTQYTIPAGGSLTSNSYYASIDFTAGFYFVHSSYTGYATTRNRNVTVQIRKGTTVHGSRVYLTPYSFSTNEENNINSTFYYSGIQAGCTGITVHATPTGNYHYYEAVYTNNSSASMVISLLISRD